MIRISCVVVCVGAACGGLAVRAEASDPWADHVVGYAPGTGVSPGYDDPSHALGEPARFSPDPNPQWSSAVTPFSPAWQSQHLVSLGAGGSLTVRFDEPVTNDAQNPYGLDLIVFGNAFFADPTFGGIAAGLGGAGRGLVEVSADGQAWFAVTPRADGMFPTLGYLDLTDPYSNVAGAVPSDYTRPVDPAFDPIGLNFAQIVAAYGASGGGTGIDIGAVGLSSVSYLRVTNPAAEFGTVDIDGFSDVSAVPAPGALVALGAAMLRRRRAHR
jgi:hypothetical protein